MSSGFLNKAVAVVLPHDQGSDDFGALWIDSDTASKQTALPDAWSGRLVAFRSFTNNVMLATSFRSGAAVASSAAPTASDAGTATQVGMTCAAGTLYTAVLPTWSPSRTCYLTHSAAAANTVIEMWAMRLQND